MWVAIMLIKATGYLLGLFMVIGLLSASGAVIHFSSFIDVDDGDPSTLDGYKRDGGAINIPGYMGPGFPDSSVFLPSTLDFDFESSLLINLTSLPSGFSAQFDFIPTLDPTRPVFFPNTLYPEVDFISNWSLPSAGSFNLLPAQLAASGIMSAGTYSIWFQVVDTNDVPQGLAGVTSIQLNVTGEYTNLAGVPEPTTGILIVFGMLTIRLMRKQGTSKRECIP